jgi:hypothetical protein
MGEPLTAQQIYDICVGGVLKQGWPSLNGSGDCRLRGNLKFGTKCAVGQLIPDGAYQPWMEEAGPISALVRVIEDGHVNIDMTDLTRRLLGDLVHAHDAAARRYYRLPAERRQKKAFIEVFVEECHAIARFHRPELNLSTFATDQLIPA